MRRPLLSWHQSFKLAELAFSVQVNVLSDIGGVFIYFLHTMGNEPSTKLEEMIDQARSKLGAEQQALVGIGFVGWVLDKFGSSESDPRLKTVLDKKVSAIWLAFGPDLGKYVAQIRGHVKATGHQTRILVNVNTVDEAKRAVKEWDADVIIVQGQQVSPNIC